MTKVAIVILNWNGEKLLPVFLPEVIKNSALNDVEIIVADNNSTDNSIKLLKTDFPEIRLIILDKNYGFTGGYNKALQQIEAEYYILLNSDIAPGKNWLPPLIETMEGNKNIAVCVPKILSYRKPEYFEYAGAGGGFIDKYGYPFCRGRLFNSIEKDNGQYDDNCDVFWASGAAMMVRSNVYKQLNGLDTDFFAHMEEIDFCWRTKNYGYRIQCIGNSKVYHLGGATLNYEDPRKVFFNFRNNLFLLTKNTPKNKLFTTLFQRFILDGIAGVNFLLSGEFKNILAVIKAHFSFYKQFNKMLKKRKVIIKNTVNNHHKEIYKKSIVFDFFIKKIKKFSELKF